MNDLGLHVGLFLLVTAIVVAVNAFTEADDARALRLFPRRYATFVVVSALVIAVMLVAEHHRLGELSRPERGSPTRPPPPHHAPVELEGRELREDLAHAAPRLSASSAAPRARRGAPRPACVPRPGRSRAGPGGSGARSVDVLHQHRGSADGGRPSLGSPGGSRAPWGDRPGRGGRSRPGPDRRPAGGDQGAGRLRRFDHERRVGQRRAMSRFRSGSSAAWAVPGANSERSSPSTPMQAARGPSGQGRSTPEPRTAIVGPPRGERARRGRPRRRPGRGR